MAYVYRITNKETKEFYIGFNNGNLTIGIDYFTSSDYVTYNKDTVGDWDTEIIWEGEHNECYDKEQELIRESFDSPLSLNRYVTKPGATPLYKVTPEVKEKMAKSQAANWEKPELRERHIETRKQKWLDPEYRARQSVSRSKGGKRRWQDPEYREEMSAMSRRTWQNPETREQIISANKERWADPEYRERQSASRKKSWADPEVKAKRSASNKKMWQDPELKAKQSASQKARWAKWRAEKNKKDEEKG